MITRQEVDELVMTAFDLIDQELSENQLHRPVDRSEVVGTFLRYFPEHADVLDRYFKDLDRSNCDAEVIAARLHQAYLESRWV